jgi:GIY-YIG catalytic domain
MMIELSQLLMESGLDPKTVAVMLHTPKDVPKKPSLRRMLPSMVREQTPMFEAYQSSHSAPATATLLKRAFVASFVAMEDSTLLLAGVYKIVRAYDRQTADLRADPHLMSLYATYGTYGEIMDGNTATLPWFDLELTDHLREYCGRLRIKADHLTPTYVRLGETFKSRVIAIEREDALAAHAPDWDEFVVTAEQIKTLPQSWANRLKEWRGVYLITDEGDKGARYVGSAYGEENLLGRWRAHVKREKGVTAELGKRDPSGFRFSILELVAKSDDKNRVTALENNWKNRLHTRTWGLNRN